MPGRVFSPGAFARNGLVIALLTAASVAAFVIGFVAIVDPAALWSQATPATSTK